MHPSPKPQAESADSRPARSQTRPGWERRVAPRSACDLPCTASLGEARMQGRVFDLSGGGAGLQLPLRVELGEVLGLGFTLPDGTAVQCDALVRSRGERGRCGVEFHNLAPPTRKAVADWLSGVLDETVAATRWRSDVGAADLDLGGDSPRLRWQLALPAVAREVLETVHESNFVFVPGPSSQLSVGQRLELQVALPFTHVVYRTQAEVIWCHDDGGIAEAGVSLRLPGLTDSDRAVLAALVASWG